jgi:hypothetical protein
MIRIISKLDKGFGEIIKEIQMQEHRVVSAVKDLGRDTANKMRIIIKQNKKRPQAGEPTSLENSIDVESIFGGKNIIGWGVGNIERMNREAPYWASFNWGSSHMVGKKVPVGGFHPGFEQPMEGAGWHSRWKKGEGEYSFTVKRPIQPTNYIEKTVHWLSGAIDKITRTLKR